MSISDLEQRLSTERTLDIFSMTPRPLKLDLSSPPSKRAVCFSTDATISFTPKATGVEVLHFEGHIFVLTDVFLICERMSPEDRAHRHGGVDMWLCYPPFSGKALRILEKPAQNNLLRISILEKETLTLQIESGQQRDFLIRVLMDCIEVNNSGSSRSPPTPSPNSGPDVIFELFGNIQLTDFTRAIQPEVTNLLWKIKGPLGDNIYCALRNDPRREEALAHIIYDRRLDKSLGDAFREYVLDSESLRFMLTPQAIRIADQRKARASPPEESSPYMPFNPPSFPATLSVPDTPSVPDIPRNPERPITPDLSKVAELMSAEALHPACTSTFRLGKILVIVFMKPNSPVYQRFSSELAELTRINKGVHFMVADLTATAISSLEARLTITGIPTTLIFSPKGYSRVVGTDRSEIQDGIGHAKRILSDQYTTPDPPDGFGATVAIGVWIALPKTINEIKVLIATKHELRATLYHAMPYIETMDAVSHKDLQSSLMSNLCAHHFSIGQAMMSCFQCGLNGEYADYCLRCYAASKHEGHRVVRRIAETDSFVCDCGRLLASRDGLERLTTCSHHARNTTINALELLGALLQLSIK